MKGRFTPKVVTANDLRLGDVVYLTPDDRWSRLHHEAELIADSATESSWALGSFFADSAAQGSAAQGSAAPRSWGDETDPAVHPAVHDGDQPKRSFSAQQVEAFFAVGGPLQQLFGPAFERRAGQVAMAAQIADAFNQGDHLLIEAGTGTGKSLAYLLPAALCAVTQGRRVVVATNTIHLQEQLLDKDLPQAARLLAECGLPALRTALLRASPTRASSCSTRGVTTSSAYFAIIRKRSLSTAHAVSMSSAALPGTRATTGPVLRARASRKRLKRRIQNQPMSNSQGFCESFAELG